MTETRLKELQTEIARLEKLDNEITNRINNEFENEDDGGMSFEDAHTNHDIVIECSANLDQAMQYESE